MGLNLHRNQPPVMERVDAMSTWHILRALLVFFCVFIIAILFGALVAFPVYEIFSVSSEVPFRKIVSRTTLLSGLLFSLLYLSYSHGLSLRQLGISPHKAHTRLFCGLIAGLAIMAIIESNLLLLGIHEPDTGQSFTLHSLSLLLLKGLMTGLLVGFIEEVIFRGALFGGLSRQTNKVVALFMVSLVYAAVHYLKFRDLPADTVVHWFTGVTMLPQALFQFADPARYDAMLTLFLLGLLLGLVRLLTDSILPCIGIHAGIISGEKIIQFAASFTPHNPHAHLVNRYDQFMGDLASAWLLVLCLLCYFYYRRRASGIQS